MAWRPKEGERRNGYLVGDDGLTSVERGDARRVERKAEYALRLAEIVEKHGLGKRNNGVAWTTEAVSEFLWREFRFNIFGPYVNDGSNSKTGVPLVGRCEKCGEVSRPTWSNVKGGRSPCNSSDCGGKRMPPYYKMDRVFKARGYELVGDYPTKNKDPIRLRHVAADPNNPGQTPCGQVMTTDWNHFAGGSGVGCGVCENLQIVVGYNDFATTHPELAELLVEEAVGLTVAGGCNAKLLFRCVEDECGGTIMRSPDQLTNHNLWPRCDNHLPKCFSEPQFHYIFPVYWFGDLIGCVWGHTAAPNAPVRLWGHVQTALAHGFELGDVTLTTGLDKTLAATNDKTPRNGLGEDWQSIPKWFGDDNPSRAEWDGWLTESAAGVTPDEVERMLGLDQYDPTQFPRVLVPIAEFYEEQAA